MYTSGSERKGYKDLANAQNRCHGAVVARYGHARADSSSDRTTTIHEGRIRANRSIIGVLAAVDHRRQGSLHFNSQPATRREV